MKDEPITIGDMAITVRLKPCCNKGMLGNVMTVKAIHVNKMATCVDCGERHEATFVEDENGEIFRLSRLKRIPPSEELNHELQPEEIQI